VKLQSPSNIEKIRKLLIDSAQIKKITGFEAFFSADSNKVKLVIEYEAAKA